MLGFLKPRGELIELSGRQVVFLADKAYKRDARFSVKLSLAEESKKRLELDVRVLSHRPGPNNRYVTVAVIETRRDFPPMKGRHIRMDRRESVGLTLKSGQFPGYRAVTADLSLGGFKTELEGELEPRDVIEVSFEFDSPAEVVIELLAEVRWVEPKGGGRFLTGFSFPRQERFEDNYNWFRQWFDQRDDVQVKSLFRPTGAGTLPEGARKPAMAVPDAQRDSLESTAVAIPERVKPDVHLHIPMRAFLRGWAWEQGDDLVIVVLEDDSGVDHWVEFQGCRGLHGRCRDRKIRVKSLRVLEDTEFRQQYSRQVSMKTLKHYQFLDDYGRVCLDIAAHSCREQSKQFSE